MSAGICSVGSNESCRARRKAPQIVVARRPKAWHRFGLVLRAIVAVPIVLVLASQRRSFLSATDRLGRISLAWLALALGAEMVSFLAAAELQHHLLAGAGARVDRRALIALTYAGTAMSATLPAGPAVAGRYTYRALTRRGATASAAAWVLAATAVLSIVTLALLGLIGAQLRGFGVFCSAIGGIVGVAVLLVGGGAVAALVWSSRHRWRLERLASSLSARCNAGRDIVARRLGRASQRGDTDVDRVSSLFPDRAKQHNALGPVRLSAALGLASANWLADIAALALAFAALGLEVPWQGLLLAYVVTQLVTSVPLLPGSIGVAEGSMAAALVCSGVHPTAAVAGVLVYRVVSFWLVVPAGWLAWMCLTRREAKPQELMNRRSARSGWAAAATGAMT
jgi:uncharacterized membrane protein YbhN (UPF0104 family)